MRLRHSHEIAMGQGVNDRMRHTAHRLLTGPAGCWQSKRSCSPQTDLRFWRSAPTRCGPDAGARTLPPVSAAFHGGYAVALPCTSPTSRTFSTSPARLARSRALRARWLSFTSMRSHMPPTARRRPSPRQSASSARRASSKRSWHRTARSCGSAPSAALRDASRTGRAASGTCGTAHRRQPDQNGEYGEAVIEAIPAVR
jgi:hypothetical protein